MEKAERPAAEALYGLVLAGGMSRRMGEDKSLLDYHGKPQWVYLAELLLPFCQKVYVSCRAGQASGFAGGPAEVLPDRQQGEGPVLGLLAAQAAQPGAAWLVVACDLPLVDAAALQQLLAGRNPAKEATAFYSEAIDGPDPLVAIWEGHGLARLASASARAAIGPFAFLKKAELELLLPACPGILANANTPEDREQLLRRLRQRS